MKMLESMYKLILLVYSSGLILSDDFPGLNILGIEPNAGPDYGETRVTVRYDYLTQDLADKYPRPKVLI
jgi:hypothetical protein